MMAHTLKYEPILIELVHRHNMSFCFCVLSESRKIINQDSSRNPIEPVWLDSSVLESSVPKFNGY